MGCFLPQLLPAPVLHSSCSHLSSDEHIKDTQPKYLSLAPNLTFSSPSPSIIACIDTESEVRTSRNETSPNALRFHTRFLSSQIKFSVFTFSNSCHLRSLNYYSHLSLLISLCSWQLDRLGFFLSSPPFFFVYSLLFSTTACEIPEKSVFKTSLSIPTPIYNLLMIIPSTYCGFRIILCHNIYLMPFGFQTLLVNILYYKTIFKNEIK